MKKKYLLILGVLGGLGAIAAMILFMQNNSIAVLHPKGIIAKQQFDLIVFTTLLILIIIVPVFALTIHIVWKYREGNTKAKYDADWDHSRAAEAIWWLVPLAIITVLSVTIWKSSHDLDPYKPIASDKKPLTIQVIALNWKWLFIYPEQRIATVNYVQFPEKTPLNFRLTSDAPMNSFWIPQLGGQVYAMAGMETKLHLEASETGIFKGSSANMSGEGFAGMQFQAKATSEAAFDAWVKTVKKKPGALTQAAYNELAKPTSNNPVAYYGSNDKSLYATVMMKYMTPGAAGHEGTMRTEPQPAASEEGAAHDEYGHGASH